MNEEPYLNNIKTYLFLNYQNQPHSVWNRLPVARRSAVFILLFMGKLGELRVVLTRRSSKLRSFPGHIALPGGRSDFGLESEWQTSRREMEEEIGLSANNEILMNNYGFEIEHLNIMPSYLSRTFLAVRPCIGFMKVSNRISEADLIQNLEVNLNPGESSSVFSCPLRDFLYPITNQEPLECIERDSYQMKWGGIPWSLRSYTFPQLVNGEADWLKKVNDLSESEAEIDEEGTDNGTDTDTKSPSTPEVEVEPKDVDEKQSNKPKSQSQKLSSWGRLGSRRHDETNEKIYDVWGLTANILHDLANVVYTKNAINAELGEEELIYSCWEHGNIMKTKHRTEEEKLLIESRGVPSEFGFNDLLSRTEFNRLKLIYKK